MLATVEGVSQGQTGEFRLGGTEQIRPAAYAARMISYWRKLPFVLLFALLCIAPVSAETSPASTQMTPAPVQQLLFLGELIRVRADQQAFELAESMRRDWEGEPDYDILYARAAMNVGSYQRAVFALERALMVYPRQLDLRLMLIEAYLGLDNTRAARRQLQVTEPQQKSPTQQRRWNALQQRVQRREVANRAQDIFTLGTELQYFTNINSGLSFDTLTVDVDGEPFEVELDGSAQAQGALATTLQGSYERVRPLSQRRQSRVVLGLTTRLSPYSEANNAGAVLAYGRETTAGRATALQFIPSWNQEGWRLTTAVRINQEDVWKTLNAGASLSWTAADEPSGQFQATVSDNFPLGPVALPWQLNSSIGLSENTAQNHLGLGGSVQPTWVPAGNWQYQAGIGLQHQWFLDDPDDADRIRNLLLQLNALALRPVQDSGLLTLRTTYQNHFSTQALNEYQGIELSVGYQYSW